MIEALYDCFLTLVYPQPCRMCGEIVEKGDDGNACTECWRKIRFFESGTAKCRKCGAYLGESGNSTDALCGKCSDQSYDKAVAVGVYEYGLAAAIIGLKSDPRLPPRCRPLFLKAYLHAGFDTATMIIPVPLSEKRALERGFNQAEVLARFLSKKTGITLRTDILVRKHHTPMHRAAMDEKARRLTVEKAFEVINKRELADAHIILVDDVLTSGATVSACAKVLKKSGAERVNVLTLARAVHN